MYRLNKRQLTARDYAESDDGFSSSDDETYYSETSSDNESDFEILEDEDNTTTNFSEWKEVPPTFIPRKVPPEYKEPETYCDENCTVTEVFLKLFPKSLFMWIADCTNERLNILSQKKGKEIILTDYHEIMIVIGCLLVMSYNRVPHMYMYWAKNKSLRNETIATAISRNRFMLIHSKLYFNQPVKPVGAVKTYYMTEVINCLVYTFNRYRSEATHQSIDEFMIKFDGRTIMKQYMPYKPVNRGIKGFGRVDASSGYMYDFYMYSGADTEPMEGTLGERVCEANFISI